MSDGKEKVTSHFQELQNLSLTIGSSLASYSEHNKIKQQKSYELWIICIYIEFPNRRLASPRSVVASMLDCSIAVSRFELQFHNYDHFQNNTIEEKYEPP